MTEFNGRYPHIVYEVTIPSLKRKNNKLSWKYIGYKTNAFIYEDKIIMSNGRQYFTSSSDSYFIDLMRDESVIKKIRLISKHYNKMCAFNAEQKLLCNIFKKNLRGYFNLASNHYNWRTVNGRLSIKESNKQKWESLTKKQQVALVDKLTKANQIFWKSDLGKKLRKKVGDKNSSRCKKLREAKFISTT